MALESVLVMMGNGSARAMGQIGALVMGKILVGRIAAGGRREKMVAGSKIIATILQHVSSWDWVQ